MLILCGALLLQFTVNANSPSRRNEPARDTVDSANSSRAPMRRRQVTAADLATAWDSPGTKELYLRARKARLTDDDGLRNYDTKMVERLTADMGVGAMGKQHMMYTHESAARVQWQRGVGAYIDMTGARVAIPMAGHMNDLEDLRNEVTDRDLSPVPYYPGMEELWPSGSVARADADDRDLVNPVANGAEAYYKFSSGDSTSFAIGSRPPIVLREIKFIPRSSSWHLLVGSLYVEERTGALVRLVYRMSTPFEMLSAIAEDDTSLNGPVFNVVKGLVSPLDVKISSVAVEYALFEGGHWLPRYRIADGTADLLFVNTPVKIEQSFTYARVNGPDTLARIVVPPGGQPLRIPDSLRGPARAAWRDSVLSRQRRARADSIARHWIKAAPPVQQCDTASSGNRIVKENRYANRLPVQLTIPCDLKKLTESPDLPPTVYDPGDSLFGAKILDDISARALSLAAQARMFTSLPHPELEFGVPMTRYNRVEGLSTGLGIDQNIGGGYTIGALGRFGFADHQVGAELSAARSNIAKTLTLTGYHRLVSAGDWGNPLSFGSSIRAFFFGHDDGFYYRASGADLTEAGLDGGHFTWRLFAEDERTADKKTDFSLAGSLPNNLTATAGPYGGASMQWTHTLGADPAGFQLQSNLRLEAAGWDSVYGRGALDLYLTRDVGAHTSAMLGASGGTSIGALPVQRRWYLGGTETVRGESPDTAQSGNAFWLAHAEIGRGLPVFRLTIFSDLGWTGDRTNFRNVGRPISGVGTGFAILDNTIRFDVARGISPLAQWKVDLYVDGRY